MLIYIILQLCVTQQTLNQGLVDQVLVLQQLLSVTHYPFPIPHSPFPDGVKKTLISPFGALLIRVAKRHLLSLSLYVRVW